MSDSIDLENLNDANEELESAADDLDKPALQQSVLFQQPERSAAALNAEARAVVRKIAQQIGSAREDGQTTAQILQSLRRDLGAGRGGLEGLLATARNQAELVQQRYYIAGQTEVLTKGSEPSQVRATWNAVGIKTCPDCIARHGITKTVEEWCKIGKPAQGATRCQHRCRCTLLAVPDAMSLYGVSNEAQLEAAAREPIQARATAIQKETKRRGKEIQKSTFFAKLGDFRQQSALRTITAESTPS